MVISSRQFFLPALAAIVLSTHSAFGEDRPSDLIAVEVQALRGDTRQPVTGLSCDDFVVLDGFLPTEIVRCDQRGTPRDILLLLDLSGGDNDEGIQFVAPAILRGLPYGDRAALMWFSDGAARLGSGLTNDREGLERLVAETFLQEQEDGARSKRSRLLDAIHSGAEFLSQNGDEGRPLIIVVTHNREGGSRVTTSNVANTLLASSIGLEAVTIPQQKRGGMPGGGMFLNPYLFPVSRNVKTPNGDAPELEGLYSVQPILARVGGQVLHLENANVRQAPLEGRPGRIGDIDSAATIASYWSASATASFSRSAAPRRRNPRCAP
jgi:hypothetical protein